MSFYLQRWFITLLLCLFSSLGLAQDSLSFKPPISPHNGWFIYGIAIIVLLLIALMLAKKNAPKLTKKSVCQLIEKKYLGNKTVVYIIDYQDQRFLLADNHQALAIHQLTRGMAHEMA